MTSGAAPPGAAPPNQGARAMRIVVTVASRHGSTALIADSIREETAAATGGPV